MPKIGKERFQISGQWLEFELFYNRNEGFYLKDFPENIWMLSEFKHVPSFATEHQLVEGTRKAIHQYHEQVKTKKKVIIVDLQLGSEYIMNKQREGSYLGHKPGVSRVFAYKVDGSGSNINRIGSYGISFNYTTAWLIDDNGKHLHHLLGNDHVGGRMSRSVDHSIVMDYTEDREEFMISVNNAFKALAEKLIGFFSKPEEDLIKAIDTKGARLLES